jgi:hypothetical protein
VGCRRYCHTPACTRRDVLGFMYPARICVHVRLCRRSLDPWGVQHSSKVVDGILSTTTSKVRPSPILTHFCRQTKHQIKMRTIPRSHHSSDPARVEFSRKYRNQSPFQNSAPASHRERLPP